MRLSTALGNRVAACMTVKRSMSLVGRCVIPCSRIAPEPARAKSASARTSSAHAIS